MMESDELVSVIIPVYNVQSYIIECLTSVIHQTYEKIEILIIDDGSTDGSGNICDEYAILDSRIRVIHQVNNGLSAARNKGLDAMSGEVIVFLDSDDALNSHYVEEMLFSLKQTQSDLVLCKYSIHETVECLTEQEPIGVWPPIEKGTYDRIRALQLLEKNKINHSVWNRMYRKELWDKIRFPEGHVFEDIDTTYKVFNLCKKICVIDKPLYLYRRRLDGIANTKSPQNIYDWFLAMAHFDSFVKSMTPEIFTIEQVNARCESRVKQMIYHYVRALKMSDDRWKSFSINLREQIIESYRANKKRISFPVQVCCWMVCDCPRLLLIAYSLVHGTLQVSRSVFKHIPIHY